MSGVQSIERAFAILRVLSLGPAGVTEVADRTDLPKSTVSRLLAALEVEGAAAQLGAGGDYTIGESLRTLAGSSDNSASLGAIIRPFVVELSEATGGSAGFTVRRDRDVYWVLNVDAADELVQISDLTGQHFPMHAVPSGLALLAHLPAEEIDGYLAEPLEAVHDQTLTDPAEIRTLLDEVAATGVIVSEERIDPGINAVAAPFRGSDDTWLGALYVQGPSFRFPEDHDLAGLVELVSAAADAVTERLTIH